MRIEPEVYSLVMNSVPMTPTANCAKRTAAQTRRDRVEGRARAAALDRRPVGSQQRGDEHAQADRQSRTVTATPMIERANGAELEPLRAVVDATRDVRTHGGLPIEPYSTASGREVHEDVFERRALRGQFVDDDPRVEGQLARPFRVRSLDGEALVVRVGDTTPMVAEGALRSLSWSEARTNTVPLAVRGEVVDRALGDEACRGR